MRHRLGNTDNNVVMARRAPLILLLLLGLINLSGVQAVVVRKSQAVATLDSADHIPKGTSEGTTHMTKPAGYGACVKFFRQLRGQDYQGQRLVDASSTMCQGSIGTGQAMYRYKEACAEIEGE